MAGRILVLLVLLCPLLEGCMVGRIYNHTTVPLTTNFHRSQVGKRTGYSDVRDLDYSYIRVRWNSNGIANIAREHGIEEVFYADLEILSIFGVWSQEWIHIYGR